MLERIEAADPLVRTVALLGAVDVSDAARILLALPGAAGPAACAVVERVVADDARLAWKDGAIALAPSPLAETALEQARFAVLDVETTSLVARAGRIDELAIVVVEAGEVVDELEVVGLEASSPETLDRAADVARGAVLAGHNVRFDLAFLEQATSAVAGVRIASPVVDTLTLARRLLAGRVERFSLAALAEFLDTSAVPCHRALPDARAAAELLLCLLALARDRGARTVGDLCALARPAPQRDALRSTISMIDRKLTGNRDTAGWRPRHIA
jgi:DNA polymerase III alpha subunit (gram-positive type)